MYYWIIRCRYNDLSRTIDSSDTITLVKYGTTKAWALGLGYRKSTIDGEIDGRSCLLGSRYLSAQGWNQKEPESDDPLV
jgi:hypothetical protein